MTQIEEIGLHPAQLIQIVLSNNNSIEHGSAFKFKVFKGLYEGEHMKYYTKSIESRDAGSSLKRVCHFLDLPYHNNIEYDHQSLLGRYCNLHVVERNINGRIRPVIIDFSFSDRELFRGYENGT